LIDAVRRLFLQQQKPVVMAPCVRRDDEDFEVVIASQAKQSIAQQKERWIASRSLSSGAHSRDPLARNDSKT
jgi:hypothetical protein